MPMTKALSYIRQRNDEHPMLQLDDGDEGTPSAADAIKLGYFLLVLY